MGAILTFDLKKKEKERKKENNYIFQKKII